LDLSIFVCDVILGEGLGFLGPDHRALNPDARGRFLFLFFKRR